MELTCPHCGVEGDETADACAACGGRRHAGRAREYDGYAVGRRVLRLAPAWLLLTVAAFGLALLFFSWLGRGGGSEGEAFRNEATNRPAPAPGAAHAAATPSKPGQTATTATPAATPEAQSAAAAAEEAGSYSVQVGAFADVSQANEQVSRLRAAGFEARVVEAGAGSRFRFQVRSGLYPTRGEAARLAAELRARGAAGETVIVEPGSR